MRADERKRQKEEESSALCQQVELLGFEPENALKWMLKVVMRRQGTSIQDAQGT